MLSYVYRHKNLTPIERHVAIAILADRNEDNFRANPSQATLKRFEPKLTESKIKTILKALRSKKIVVGVAPPGQVKAKLSNWYFFAYDLPQARVLCDRWPDDINYKSTVAAMIETAQSLFDDPDKSLRARKAKTKLKRQHAQLTS